jgi:hypothetical protein
LGYTFNKGVSAFGYIAENDEVNKFFSSLEQNVDTLSFEPKKNENIISSDWMEVFLFENGKINAV